MITLAMGNKDRLAELQRQSKHAPVTEEEEMEPLNKNKKQKGAKGDDPEDTFERFLERFGELTQDIDRVSQNVEELRTLQGEVLRAVHRDEAVDVKMDNLNAENKRLGKKIRNVLKADQDRMEASRKQSPSNIGENQRAEMKMRQTQLNSQSRRFYDAWAQYNEDQVSYRRRRKDQMLKKIKVAGTNMSDDQIEQMIDEGKTEVFAKSILDQTQVARQQLTELQDRHDEFIKLEKSITEVRDMFFEVAQLVQDQGEMIDNIAVNVGRAETDVEAGKGHLDKARTLRASARKKKIILAIVLAIVILIVILVVLDAIGLI